MKILTYPNDKLTVKCKEVVDIKKAVDTANNMLTTLFNTSTGVGLSAPQVGCEERIIVFTPDRKEKYIMFNPVIIRHGKSTDIMKEGCLSFPNMEKEIERYTVIDVKYTDINGQQITTTFKRWVARIIQHEIDHLDGILCMI